MGEEVSWSLVLPDTEEEEAIMIICPEEGDGTELAEEKFGWLGQHQVLA
jgi:hypothetical protein